MEIFRIFVFPFYIGKWMSRVLGAVVPTLCVPVMIFLFARMGVVNPALTCVFLWGILTFAFGIGDEWVSSP